MAFLAAFLIVAVSCIVITARTLTAYGDYPLWVKYGVYVLMAIAWFAPMLIWNLQSRNIFPVSIYAVLAKTGYFLFGFAFILVILIIIRDILWGIGYFASGKRIVSPNDCCGLVWANLITLGIAFALSLYALYSAEKLPKVLHYAYQDARIQRPLRVLTVSDIHINKMFSVAKARCLVQYLNDLQPDVLLLVGDIGDDRVSDVQAQIKELGKLNAPMGIYFTLGNHETYFNAYEWEAEFAGLGWQVLHNSGSAVGDTGLYIAGLPDVGRFPSNIKQSLRQADSGQYRILMSHIPAIVDKIGASGVDIQVSGHTHGGQIFPFNYLAKAANGGYVAGEYKVNNTTLLVSRGVGYWGPSMRLFAPNDVLLITLSPLEQ